MDKTDIIKKYALQLSNIGFSVGDSPRIFLRHGNCCYATETGADLSQFEYAFISDVTQQKSLEKDILMGSRDMRGMIVARTPYVGICADSQKTIPATLDDMAQIVGRQVKVVPRTLNAITSALRSATCVMVKREGQHEGYVIATGRNLYEAYVSLLVLEKSAEIVLKAQVIGGAKPLGAFDCKLMREVYKRKYSKAEKERKDDVEG